MSDVIALDPPTADAQPWTLREIRQQPDTLRATQALLMEQRQAIDAFLQPRLRDPAMRIILAGAGTSAFIGEALAPWLAQVMRRPVEAIATTDLVSAPDLHLAADRPTLLVSFGRSGNSPESIGALQLADARVRSVAHLIVTCNPEGALARRSGPDAHVVLLPEATHDRGFAMTSSFSAMMLAALSIFTGPDAMADRVEAIARSVAGALDGTAAQVKALAERGDERVVYLGSGVLKGLAREAALKLLELTDGATATLADTPLGFRHGPKTFLTPRTLAIVFLSNDPATRRYDLDLLDELRRDGRCGAVVAVSAQEIDGMSIRIQGLEAAADADLLFPFIVPAQLLGLAASLHLNLTPDQPNASGTVNRVVQGVKIYPAEA